MIDFLWAVVWWAGLFSIAATLGVGIAAMYAGLRDRRKRRAVLRERDAWARELADDLDRWPDLTGSRG